MSSSITPNLVQQLQTDVTAIVAVVEQLTGRKSTWNRHILIGMDLDAFGLPAYLGAKPWNCDITLHQSRLLSPARYSTLLHEAFHSVSAGLTESDYALYRWREEAVVEQCTRLFRNEVFARAGLPAPIDARSSYTDKVGLLEDLGQRTQRTQQDFALALLQTELPNRERTMLQWIQSVETTKTFPQIEQETLLLRNGLRF